MFDLFTEKQALDWWENLTLSQKISYEYQTFSDGDALEDNTLNEKDIVLMFNKYKSNI